MHFRKVNFNGVVPQFCILEVEDEWPVVGAPPALWLEDIVRVHICLTVLRHVFFDHLSDALSQADFHTWVQIGEASELISVMEGIFKVDASRVTEIFIVSIGDCTSERCTDRF